jgi:hypothetical protein
VVIVETGKQFPIICQGLLSNFLPSGSSLSFADYMEKAKPHQTCRCQEQKGPFCHPEVKAVGFRELIEVH